MTGLSHSQKKRRASLLFLASLIGTGLVAGFILRGQDAGMHPWLAFGLLVLVVAIGGIATLPWWRRLDDMQKAAQYESWFWGGSTGAALALLGLFVFTGTQSEASLGAMVLFAAQVAGFVLAWIWWRIRYGGGGL